MTLLSCNSTKKIEYTPEVITVKDSVPQVIRLVEDSIIRDTIVYKVTTTKVERDTIFIPKTKTELKYIYKEQKLDIRRIEDSLRLELDKDIKIEKERLKSNKKSFFDRIGDLFYWVIVVILILFVVGLVLRYVFK